MEVALRNAGEADFDAMCSIYRAVCATGDTLPAAGDEPRDAIHRDWLEEDRPTVVAVDGARGTGRVVGMYKWGANRGHRGDHVATATFVVDPPHQGRGIGTRLVAHCLAAAGAAGFLGIQFNFVVSTNTRAVALYQRHGMTIVGTLPRAFRHATLGLVDAFVMFRTFDPASTGASA